MDPGGVSSHWGNENKCLQQVFRKGEPVSSWLNEKIARSGGEWGVSSVRHSPWKTLRSPFLRCTPLQLDSVNNAGVQGKERMARISWICGPHQNLYFPEGRAVLAPKGYSKGPLRHFTKSVGGIKLDLSPEQAPGSPPLGAGLGSSPSSSGTNLLPARPTILRARRGSGALRHMLPAGLRPHVVLIAQAVLSPSKARAFFSLMGHEVNNNAGAPSLQKQRSGERLPQRIFFSSPPQPFISIFFFFKAPATPGPGQA